jgi:hypothetical protein
MSVPKRVRTIGILLSITALQGLPAMSQDGNGAATNDSAATSAPSGASAPLPGPGISPAGVAPAGAPAGSGTLTHESQLAPGHLLEPRRMLFQRLLQARQEGIGIGPYMQAFGRLEDSVRSGGTPEMLQPQIENLARSLKSQIDRSQMLKTQRPIPAQGSQAAGGAIPPMPGIPGPGAAGAMAGGGKTSSLDGLLEKVKERLQTGDIPDSLKERLNSDKGRKLLEKLGQ